jgi:hypothetical protein
MATSVLLCPGLKSICPLIIQPTKVTMVVTMTTPPIGGFGPLTEDGAELQEPRPTPVAGHLRAVIADLAARYSMAGFLAAYEAGKVR